MTPAPTADQYPLAFPQRALWAACQVQDDAHAYNMSEAYRVTGALDLSALRMAVDAVVRTHEILRTAFVPTAGDVVQRVCDVPADLLEHVDLSGIADAEAEAMRRCDAAARAPFDLTSGRMLRVAAMSLAPGDHVLLFTVHHIAFDAWSARVLIDDLLGAYGAAVRGERITADEGRLQYRDYAVWQQALVGSGRLATSRAYWERTLGSRAAGLELPADRPRPPRRSLLGGHVTRTLDAPSTEAILRLAREHAATPFIVVQALVKSLLYLYTGQADITVGTLTAGRFEEALERQVGCYLNTLALRDRLDPGLGFSHAIARVRETTLSAFEHQLYPFDKLLADLHVKREAGRQPLFDVMVNVLDAELTTADLADAEWESGDGALRVTRMPLPGRDAKYDLTWNVEAKRDATHITLEFSTDLFDRGTAVAILDRFCWLLGAVSARPERALRELADEAALPAARLTAPPRATREPLGGLYDRFERMVRQAPDAIALSDGARTITYAELDRRARTVAEALMQRGVGAEARVAICIERTAELVVAIMAVLRAGGAYVPIDPEYPGEHIEYLAADCGARVAITGGGVPATARDALARAGVECIDVDAAAASAPARAVFPPVDAAQAAYVIYTSGSTGRPKGCVVSHANVMRLLDATAAAFAFGARDVFTLFHSCSFDFSVWELWGALAYGGRLVVVSRDTARDPAAFVSVLRRERVTVLNQTPSAFYRIVDDLAADAGAVRVIVFGGEALDFARLRPLVHADERMPMRLVNMYGITETTVHVTYREVAVDDVLFGATSAIGEPLDDLAVFVLDPELEPVPIGAVGEICVAGGGLSRGYLGRAALTAERFVPNPFAARPGERLYRSGDLARRLANGDMEYMGRADHQIKIRGFRIEPREIEAALMSHRGVRAALVVALRVGGGDPRLVAYTVPATPLSAPSTGDLRTHLLGRLPAHMVPASFVSIDAFPLTQNGKIDRAALPLPDREGDAPVAIPAGAVERALVDIWRDLLRVSNVGVHDNFFELGGDSILSVQMASRAAAQGIALGAQAVFQHQTIAELATVATSAVNDAAEQGAVTGPVQLAAIQRWFLERQLAFPERFSQSLLLAIHHPDIAVLTRALECVIAHHDALRSRVWHNGRDWQAEIAAPGAPAVLEQVDLSALPHADRRAAIDEQTRVARAMLDPARGRMLVARLLRVGPGEADRLLLVAHHLVIDAVSWRILAEDLEAAYRAVADGGPVRLPPKSASVREWAEQLRQLASSGELDAERRYWEEVASRPTVLPGSGRRSNALPAASDGVQRTRIDRATTARLLSAPRERRAVIDEVLVAALAACWREAGASGMRIDMEHHGRDAFGAALDGGRTVGWFTCLYPVWIALDDSADVLDASRDALRAVPRRGVGYGVLRDVARDPVLRAAEESRAVFNYLGVVDRAPAAGAAFTLAPESPDEASDEPGHRTHALEITASVRDGALDVLWSHDATVDPAIVATMADRFASTLGAILDRLRDAIVPPESAGAGLAPGDLDDLLADIPEPE
ncbi:MAG TPA: amino acid adenylation domain-containing protein [Gemmatimonadaceae bacterium]|nr:amino acid adenylation domain-containing protein [Gemmatimonadaceae bacterium]